MNCKYEVDLTLKPEGRESYSVTVPIYNEKKRWRLMSEEQKEKDIKLTALELLEEEMSFFGAKYPESMVESYTVRQFE